MTKPQLDLTEYARKFDANNKHWSKHPGDNQSFLLVTQNWMNERLRALGVVFLNDVHDALGFDRTRKGQIAGWTKASGRSIDFNLITIETDRGADFILNFTPDEDVLDGLS